MEAIRCTNASSARDRRRRTEGANAADQRRDDVDSGRLSSSPSTIQGASRSSSGSMAKAALP